jgi:hypothetical protein
LAGAKVFIQNFSLPIHLLTNAHTHTHTHTHTQNTAQYEKDGTEFDSTEYMAETPHWALKGAIEEGFDPVVRTCVCVCVEVCGGVGCWRGSVCVCVVVVWV